MTLSDSVCNVFILSVECHSATSAAQSVAGIKEISTSLSTNTLVNKLSIVSSSDKSHINISSPALWLLALVLLNRTPEVGANKSPPLVVTLSAAVDVKLFDTLTTCDISSPYLTNTALE